MAKIEKKLTDKPIESREEKSPFYTLGMNDSFISTEEKKEAARKFIETEYKKDHRPVRGIFHFHERPGQSIRFPFRKYRQDPVMHFELEDGQIYTIPYMVARHLAENCYIATSQGGMNEFGKPFTFNIKKRRMTFQSLEFTHDPDLVPVGQGSIHQPQTFNGR